MKIQLRPDKEIRVEKAKVGRVPVLILRPAGPARENRTGVLWIPGGGYLTGMKEMVYMSRAADLVKRCGVTAVSPGYRLAWLHPYPAALEDCWSTLAWMHEEAEGLGFSRDRIMVGGESAGGGLAAAVCMMARDRGLPVAFQMPLYPMISNLDTETSRDNHGRIWTTRRNHLGWRLYLRGQAGKPVLPYAAPAGQTDWRGLPPCYTFVGEGEPFRAETLQYVENLRSAGVPAEADVYPTGIHAFDMLYPEQEVSRQAIAGFHRHFEDAMKQLDDHAQEFI